MLGPIQKEIHLVHSLNEAPSPTQSIDFVWPIGFFCSKEPMGDLQAELGLRGSHLLPQHSQEVRWSQYRHVEVPTTSDGAGSSTLGRTMHREPVARWLNLRYQRARKVAVLLSHPREQCPAPIVRNGPDRPFSMGSMGPEASARRARQAQ